MFFKEVFQKVYEHNLEIRKKNLCSPVKTIFIPSQVDFEKSQAEYF